MTRLSGQCGGLGRGLRERYPGLRSDLPMGSVTFELELEGHWLGQNERCGQRGENEWRLRSSGSWVGWKHGVYLGRSQRYEGEVSERLEKHSKGRGQRHFRQTPFLVRLSQ